MNRETYRTDFLVLRKTPHLGSNLIVSGISPEYGRLAFYLKHAAGGDKHHFQQFDAFRLLSLEFTRGKNSDFCRCVEAELSADYTEVAKDYAYFQTACWLAQFCLANILDDDARPLTFTAACVALNRLAAKTQTPAAVLTGFSLNYLMESGWLNVSSLTAREQAQCRILITMGAGGDMPALTPENWEQLWAWTHGQLRRAELVAEKG